VVAVAAAAAAAKAGISLRRAHAAEAFVRSDSLDLIEIVADHFLRSHPRHNAELEALRSRFTIVPHGLDLSLGSAEGLNERYLRDLKALIDVLQPPYWTEHVAFTRAGGRAIGHLAPIPFTHEALDVLCRNVLRAQVEIGFPLALENIACPFDVPFAEMTEGAFLTQLVERTGCGLLLDVANLYYNARNRGLEPARMLDDYPLGAVVQCHLAGGHRARGEWIDSHAHPVPEEVWQLFETVVSRSPVRVAIVERDEHLPSFAELAGEAARARAIMRRAA